MGIGVPKPGTDKGFWGKFFDALLGFGGGAAKVIAGGVTGNPGLIVSGAGDVAGQTAKQAGQPKLGQSLSMAGSVGATVAAGSPDKPDMNKFGTPLDAGGSSQLKGLSLGGGAPQITGGSGMSLKSSDIQKPLSFGSGPPQVESNKIDTSSIIKNKPSYQLQTVMEAENAASVLSPEEQDQILPALRKTRSILGERMKYGY